MINNLTDLKGWPNNKLPVAASWALGHNIDWNTAQIAAGGRLLPTYGLAIPELMNVAKQATTIDTFAASFGYISSNNLPLILRHQTQVSGAMISNRGTFPDRTAAEWRYLSDGTLDSRPLCDCFAPTAMWSSMGSAYATSGVVTKLQQVCPNPSFVGIWDNNEGAYPSPKMYSNQTQTTRSWKPRPELGGISINMRNRVDALGYGSDPYNFWPEFFSRRKAQYQAFYTAFKDGWAGWAGKPLRTNAYSAGALAGWTPPEAIMEQIGYAPEAVCYDGAGASLYPGTNSSTNLLDAQLPTRINANIKAWEWAEARNPNSFRTIFVSISGKAALIPKVAGQHEIVTPDIFRGWCEWMAWTARKSSGGPLLIQHWIGNSTKPTDAFFAPTDIPKLEALGRMDLADLTHEAYTKAPMLAADSICREGLREFWQSGITVPITVSSGTVKVVCTRLGDRYLCYVWSPCITAGQVGITILGFGTINIDAPSNGSAYWVMEPPAPVGLIPRRLF